MVRPFRALGVLAVALPSWACSVHITTGPSSAVNRISAPRAEPVRVVSVTREPRARKGRVSDTTSSHRERRRERRREREARHGGTSSRDVATFVTSSHTGDATRRKPRVAEVGRWASADRDGGRGVSQSERPRAERASTRRSKDNPAESPTEGLPRGDGKLQQLSRPEPEAQPAGPRGES